MLDVARTPGASRFAAALVALALTGVPQLATRGAPARVHRCNCPSRGSDHDCACPLCQSAARARRASGTAKPPSCHRGAAAKALAASEPSQPVAPGRVRSTPCISGSCGTPEQHAVSTTGADPFTLQPKTPIHRPQRAELLVALRLTPSEWRREPEKPPPRPA